MKYLLFSGGIPILLTVHRLWIGEAIICISKIFYCTQKTKVYN